MHILPLIQKQHGAEVPDPLVREPRRSYQLEALQLTEVRWVTQHMDVQEFGNVSTSAGKVV